MTTSLLTSALQISNSDSFNTEPDENVVAIRAAFAWQRIQDKPELLVVRRRVPNTSTEEVISGQVVRVEMDDASLERRLDAGPAAFRSIGHIHGVVGHPDPDVPDTDLRIGDRFSRNGMSYKVMYINLIPGELQAFVYSEST